MLVQSAFSASLLLCTILVASASHDGQPKLPHHLPPDVMERLNGTGAHPDMDPNNLPPHVQDKVRGLLKNMSGSDLPLPKNISADVRGFMPPYLRKHLHDGADPNAMNTTDQLAIRNAIVDYAPLTTGVMTHMPADLKARVHSAKNDTTALSHSDLGAIRELSKKKGGEDPSGAPWLFPKHPRPPVQNGSGPVAEWQDHLEKKHNLTHHMPSHKNPASKVVAQSVSSSATSALTAIHMPVGFAPCAGEILPKELHPEVMDSLDMATRMAVHAVGGDANKLAGEVKDKVHHAFQNWTIPEHLPAHVPALLCNKTRDLLKFLPPNKLPAEHKDEIRRLLNGSLPHQLPDDLDLPADLKAKLEHVRGNASALEHAAKEALMAHCANKSHDIMRRPPHEIHQNATHHMPADLAEEVQKAGGKPSAMSPDAQSMLQAHMGRVNESRTHKPWCHANVTATNHVLPPPPPPPHPAAAPSRFAFLGRMAGEHHQKNGSHQKNDTQNHPCRSFLEKECANATDRAACIRELHGNGTLEQSPEGKICSHFVKQSRQDRPEPCALHLQECEKNSTAQDHLAAKLECLKKLALPNSACANKIQRMENRLTCMEAIKAKCADELKEKNMSKVAACVAGLHANGDLPANCTMTLPSLETPCSMERIHHCPNETVHGKIVHCLRRIANETKDMDPQVKFGAVADDCRRRLQAHEESITGTASTTTGPTGHVRALQAVTEGSTLATKGTEFNTHDFLLASNEDLVTPPVAYDDGANPGNVAAIVIGGVAAAAVVSVLIVGAVVAARRRINAAKAAEAYAHFEGGDEEMLANQAYPEGYAPEGYAEQAYPQGGNYAM